MKVGLYSIKNPAGIITAIAMLVLMTPLCGFLFDCGCTWPWAGLESNCNIHQQGAAHQCPWCVSFFAGAFSLGSAMLVGFLLSIMPSRSGYDVRNAALVSIQPKPLIPVVIQRTLVGLIGFTLMAAVTGWLSAYVQGYPYFIFISGWPL